MKNEVINFFFNYTKSIRDKYLNSLLDLLGNCLLLFRCVRGAKFIAHF